MKDIRARRGGRMLLFILGLFLGWFLGFLLTAIVAAGKRDDSITEEVYKKLA